MNQLQEPAGIKTAELPLTPTSEARTVGPLEPDESTGQDYMSIVALWNIVVSRRWTVLTVAVVIATLVAISTFRTQPVYKAAAHVQVEAETPLIQSLTDLYQSQQNWGGDDLFLQTQIEILESDALAWQTIEGLHLSENPKFWAAGAAQGVAPEQRKEQLIAAFRGGLGVQLVPKSRMLLVGYESTDPELAARISNSLVANYIDYNFRQKYDATRQASEWLEQQLDELKAKVEKSQEAMVAYERANDITDVNDKQNVQSQMLSDLSKDLTSAQSDRIQKESLYNQIRTNRAQMAVRVDNTLLQKLEDKQADLQSQYTELANQYGPNYPKVLRTQQQLADVRSQIDQERNRVVERIHGDYLAAVDRERLALVAANQQKDKLGTLNQLMVEHNILKRDFETNQQLYQSLLQKLKDATVSAGLRSTNIHLVDPARKPTAPIRPRKLMNTAIGILAGMMFGVMFAFVQEALDQSAKNVDEIELLLGTPALGIIPSDRNVQSVPAIFRNRPFAASSQDGVTLTAVKAPSSVMAEAYRSLRTAVLMSLPSKSAKTILVTSTKAGEGKTITSINLAQVMAHRKGPVLLVDCDLRKSGIGALLEIENGKGLTGILQGTATLDEVLLSYPGMPGLSILPAGPSVENPTELLSSDKMIELLSGLVKRFEHIIIDSPPVLAVTDAAILAGMVDGVLLVIENGKTHKGAVARSHQILLSSGGNVLGLVFNKFDRQEGAYGYGGYYQYYSSPSYPQGSRKG